jgi:hypothetical protein
MPVQTRLLAEVEVVAEGQQPADVVHDELSQVDVFDEAPARFDEHAAARAVVGRRRVLARQLEIGDLPKRLVAEIQRVAGVRARVDARPAALASSSPPAAST